MGHPTSSMVFFDRGSTSALAGSPAKASGDDEPVTGACIEGPWDTMPGKTGGVFFSTVLFNVVLHLDGKIHIDSSMMLGSSTCNATRPCSET